MNDKDRVLWLDALRVCATFMVIILHLAAQNFKTVDVAGNRFLVFVICDSAVRCVVPIFVMISGVFFLDPNRTKTLKSLYSKNILRMVTSFVIWSLIYRIWYYYSNNISYNPVKFWSGVATGHYHLWYIFMIIALYIISPILKKITSDKKITEYYMIICVIMAFIVPQVQHFAGGEISVVIEKITHMLYFYFPLGYVFYFLAGYYFYSYEIKKWMEYCIFVLGIIATVLLIVCTRNASIAAGVADVYFYDNLNPFVMLQTLMVFTFFKNRVSGHMNIKKSGSKILAWLSNCSYGVYLVHIFVIEAIKYFCGITTVSCNSAVAMLGLFVVVSIVSFAISSILNYIPIVKKYMV